MARTIGVVCVLVLALAIGGCGKGSDGDVSIDRAGKKVTITGADGETKGEIGEGVKVPTDFPKDVPVQGAGRVIAAFHRDKSFHVTLMTKDTAQKVVDDYRSKMKAAGWTEEQSMDLGTAKMVHFRKGDRRASITATSTDEGTTVSVTTEKEEGQQEE